MEPSARRARTFRIYAWATVAATLAVILWGAYVRASGSGAGCGSHWPTCNGQVLPRSPSAATVIELTHRVTSGLAFFMTMGLVGLAFVTLPKRHPGRSASVASMVFMVLEALVGAALVLLEHVAMDRSVMRAVWTSIHLINTFLLVASMTLTAWWASDRPAPAVVASNRATSRALLAVSGLGLLGVGVTGAITALGDTLFRSSTLVEGIRADLSPTAHYLQQLRVIHPIAAVVVAVLTITVQSVIRSKNPSPAVDRAGKMLAAALASQLALGLVNLVLLAPIPLQIAHLLLADLAWMAFVIFAASALVTSAERRDVLVDPRDDGFERGAGRKHSLDAGSA